MWRVTVAPIARVGAETLDYFSTAAVEPGWLVEIPVRGRSAPARAVVLSVRDARKEKSAIRAGGFQLRKLAGVRVGEFVTPALMRAAHRAADWHATTLGAVLASLLPTSILETPPVSVIQCPKSKESSHSAPVLIENTEQKRLAEYKTIVSKTLASRHSAFVITPTVHDAERLHNALGETESILIHGKLSKKKFLKHWCTASESQATVCVVGTAAILALPREDIGTVIVERESHRAYKAIKRPFLDARIIAKYFAEETGAQLVLGDRFVRVETREKRKSSTGASHQHPDITIATMRTEKTFSAIGSELKNMLDAAQREHKRVFVFAARRGVAGTTVCRDCGESVVCNACRAPLTLHGKTTARFFLCHRCGKTKNAKTTCTACGSWNLVPLGVGIERAEAALAELFPDMPRFRIDADATPTDSKAQTVADTWHETSGGILLGTERALPFVEHTFYTAVVSLDALLSVPDFRMNERIFRLLLECAEKTEKRLLVQTRLPDADTLLFAQKNDRVGFFTHEHALRKQFNHPPFSVLIKITLPKRLDEHARKALAQALKPYTIHRLPDTPQTLLVKVPRDRHPDPALTAVLRSLAPAVAVDVNPGSVV